MESENITVIDNYTLASSGQRITAAIIDLIVYGFLSAIFGGMFWLFGLHWLGQAIAILYLLFRDSLAFLNYQSIGKKIIRLRVIDEKNNHINHISDIKRNFIFIPNFINSFGISFLYIGGAFTLLFLLIELFLLVTNDDNQRLGDKFADTLVIQEN